MKSKEEISDKIFGSFGKKRSEIDVRLNELISQGEKS